MKKFLLGLFLFGIGTVYAFNDLCPGEYGLSAEWLYMISSIDQPYFTIVSSSATDMEGERKANAQGWHSGYRLEGRYRFCNEENDFLVRWTHIPEFKAQKAASGNLFVVFTQPDNDATGAGEMTIRDKTDFYYFEALFGQKAIERRRFNVALQAGIQFCHLGFKEEVTFIPDPLSNARSLEMESHFWGIGPEIGADCTYCLMDCWDLVGRGSVAFLASRREAKFNQPGAIKVVDVHNEAYWHLVPAGNLRFGLNYLREQKGFNCFGCRFGGLTFNFEAGYEFIVCHKGVERIYFVDELNDGQSFNEEMDFVLHGPYVHLGFAF
ncbi:MAG: hypothetical protein KR126chlam2_01258 [Chlamydiae bacterium]|nr:hypothetical protein [Chlamydiota bacterium]